MDVCYLGRSSSALNILNGRSLACDDMNAGQVSHGGNLKP